MVCDLTSNQSFLFLQRGEEGQICELQQSTLNPQQILQSFLGNIARLELYKDVNCTILDLHLQSCGRQAMSDEDVGGA